MNRVVLHIYVVVAMLCGVCQAAYAQRGPNDTIRLGGIEVEGKYYPMIFLPEFTRTATMLDAAARQRLNALRTNVYVVYPYALTAAAVFKKVNEDLEKQDGRRNRKKYLKQLDHQLDACFKEPLKNLSINQGHVLIKLINRQTGQDCYHVIKELKGGLSAFVWQSVGVFFNNNLKHEYDPEGEDRELETIVRELEASTAYRYQLYLQEEMMKRTGMK